MRIILNFTMNDSFMPLDYHRFCIKFIKNALAEYQNGRHYEQFYGAEALQNGEKDFSFALKFPSPKFYPNRIEVAEKQFEMLFVCPTLSKAMLFSNAFLGQKTKEFPISEHNSIQLTKMHHHEEDVVKGNLAHFRLCSPLLLREHTKEGNKDVFYSVENEGFVAQLKQILKYQCKDFEEQINAMKIDISALKKTVVRFYDMQINASVGDIKILASPELLNKMLHHSIGSKRSAGFGVLRLMDSWEMME